VSAHKPVENVTIKNTGKFKYIKIPATATRRGWGVAIEENKKRNK
jgi:hypothetical protein